MYGWCIPELTREKSFTIWSFTIYHLTGSWTTLYNIYYIIGKPILLYYILIEQSFKVRELLQAWPPILSGVLPLVFGAKKLEPYRKIQILIPYLWWPSLGRRSAFREKRETRLFLKSGCKGTTFFPYMQIFCKKTCIFCQKHPNCAIPRLQTRVREG